MDSPHTLDFERGLARWDAHQESVIFYGSGPDGRVYFMITSDALAELSQPGRERLDRQSSIETFFQFENDIFRIAQREYLEQGRALAPVPIFRAMVKDKAGPGDRPHRNDKRNIP